MAYVDLPTFKGYVAATNTTQSSDEVLMAALRAAEQEIDNYCHRNDGFSRFETTTGTRYYRAEDITTLPIGTQYRSIAWPAGGGYSWDRYPASGAYVDNAVGYEVLWLGADLQSVDTLTNGNSATISSTGYWLEPRNEKPYRYIRLKSSESWIFNTDGEIEVAGSWGFSTAPDADIKELVKETALYLYKLRITPVMDVTAEPAAGIVTIPKGMPIHVKMALDRGGYVRQFGVK